VQARPFIERCPHSASPSVGGTAGVVASILAGRGALL